MTEVETLLSLLNDVTADLDQALNRVYATQLGYAAVAVSMSRPLSVYQALGTAHRNASLVRETLQTLADRERENAQD